MKLYREEWDILIAYLGNEMAMARAQGDDEFADYAEKRIAKFKKAQADGCRIAQAPPSKRQHQSPADPIWTRPEGANPCR